MVGQMKLPLILPMQFPADATLTSQGGRGTNPSLPGVPSSASAAGLGSGIVCSDGCSKITC